MTVNNTIHRIFAHISTHTLTWSVTLSAAHILLYLNYFNSHAHVERDLSLSRIIEDKSYFNSHAHVERDVSRLVEQLAPVGISTHTLTWSVTRNFAKLLLYPIYFNSHAHVERDTMKRMILQFHCHFNSHAHVERDLSRFAR